MTARVGWWGGPDTRLRCDHDDKVIKESREAAEQTAAAIRQRRPKPGDERMEAYQCAVGNWHVGHAKRKRR